MPRTHIDLNADLAEEAGDDAALLPFLSSANLCCGAHAGGPAVLRAALAACKAAGVTAGAHPGYPDRANFGRIVVPMTPAAITAMVATQVAAACVAAAETGTRVAYVKPHGALYNLGATDAAVAAAIAAGVAQVDRGLVLLGLAGSAMLTEGTRAGLATAAEAFADRAYAPDGTLVPRGQPGAVLHDPDTVAARALAMVQDGAVTAIDGTRIPLRADSLCLHGDTPGALALARATRAALDAAGIAVRPFA
jgi:UPF0271 protein